MSQILKHRVQDTIETAQEEKGASCLFEEIRANDKFVYIPPSNFSIKFSNKLKIMLCVYRSALPGWL